MPACPCQQQLDLAVLCQLHLELFRPDAVPLGRRPLQQTPQCGVPQPVGLRNLRLLGTGDRTAEAPRND
ncbi:receptor-like protein kinase [Iris pallida]|uniref:Receptor-like protein kinase n=1 Tax=Iris pallida TaxID=29817 RepID=A0AAX6I4L5_IRIPA|nr:receptor-like protein kinase [Iris pallida]